MVRRLGTMAAALVVSAVNLAAQTQAPAQTPRYPFPENIQAVHIAMLYRGPNYVPGTSPENQKLQEGHLAHLAKLGKEGHAFIAGPIGGGGDLAGIVMMKAPTAEAARALEAEDPAVKAGRLRIEMVTYMSPGNWFSFGPIKEGMSMRAFVFGFLKTKPGAKPPDAAMLDAHLATLWSMRQAGTLLAAGPTVPTVPANDRAGVFVLAVDSVDKARAMLEQEPSVKNGVFSFEMYRWSAADGIMKGK